MGNQADGEKYVMTIMKNARDVKWTLFPNRAKEVLTSRISMSEVIRSK